MVYNGPFMESYFFETMGLVEITPFIIGESALDNNGAITVNDGDFNTFILIQ